MLKDVFLAGGVRTAIGAFGGTLAEVPAPILGSIVIRAALKRARVMDDQVDEVIMGNVLCAGLGQNPARQAMLAAGLPTSVGATTVNKVCGSGLKSVMLAAQAIQSGDAQVVVAGGMENMSAAPYLLKKARTGYRMGHGQLIDAMIHDGLWDVFGDVHVGCYGDKCAVREQFSRKAQDDYAVASYQRALCAQADGVFAKEITPVEIQDRNGVVVIDEDEEPGRFNEEKLRQLKPAFGNEGSITAGNASSVDDAAAALVMLSPEKVRTLGVTPQAKILGYCTVAREPEWFPLAPIAAIAKLMLKLGWTTADVDLFEVNEAFSVVPMAVMKNLGVPHEKMNIFGGAVALGHPIGASGTRVLVTLLNALQQRGLRTGIASLCIGGGEAVAMAVERV